LLVGPPGSGKTKLVLNRVADGNAQLVVPTASMAEHLLHEMARGDSAVAPDAILPLAGYVAALTPGCREVSPALEILLLEQALERTGEFASVARYPGFQAGLLETVKELWSAGGTRGGALGRVIGEFEKLLAKAGAVHRAERLRLAAAATRSRKRGTILFDGFFNFTPVEIELLRGLAQTAEELVVTLPEAGADEARQALIAMGLRETRLERVWRPVTPPVVVRAPTPEREIEDIAGRILADQARTHRPFRDYGLILRNPDQYGPLIEAVFERFGIPVRWQRAQALERFASSRLLMGLLGAAAAGFESEETLAALKLAGSGIGTDRQMDQYEFALKADAPGQGLAFLRRRAERFPRVRDELIRLEKLAGWASERAAPDTWAARSVELARQWFHPPEIRDGIAHETALQWRTLARALEAFDGAAREAAAALSLAGSGPVGLPEYLATLARVARQTPVRARDLRRNAAQALSVYEARQWELPVVFVCGLVERQFPRHHSQNLFIDDAERRKLAATGVRLRTTGDLEREERFLFDLARSRATEQLYLTYPAQNEDGTETLRSFFLEEWDAEAIEAGRARPSEPAPPWRPPPGSLQDPALRRAVALRHEWFSPSALERYLQCPYQFFAEHTLRLNGPPPAPQDRLDELVKGTIIHRTIARWTAGGGDIGPVFEEVFAEVCSEEGIRLNFRAEVIRIGLREDLERFAAEEGPRLGAGRVPLAEQRFEYVVDEVTPPFRVRGRIDRYEVSEGGAALVVDYKYSTQDRLEKLIEEHEAGARVQGPLYMLGLEKQRNLKPAGIVFQGLRGESSRRGWYVVGAAPPDPDLEEKTPQEFHKMLEAAAARALGVVTEIRDGRVAVEPRDRSVCRRFCPYLDVCRVNL
jgi:RecB family exonuclease